jgi:hypothetical protein
MLRSRCCRPLISSERPLARVRHLKATIELTPCFQTAMYETIMRQRGLQSHHQAC